MAKRSLEEWANKKRKQKLPNVWYVLGLKYHCLKIGWEMAPIFS